jgi:hypothetical protein
VTRAVCVVLLAACDLRPAPKPAPPRDAAAIVVAADADELAACTAVARHIADVMIAEADATAKVALEHDRDRLVQRAAEGCNRDHWSDDTLGCYTRAQNRAEIDRCKR